MKNTALTPEGYLLKVKSVFAEEGDPEVSIGQRKYMRHQFDFYGLKMPKWTALARTFFKELGGFADSRLASFAELCYDDDYREIQYFGTEMVQRNLKSQQIDLIHCLETLIKTKSWWDTVDWLAKLVGLHFKRFPELQRPVCEKWISTDNIWLQRVTMILQLHWHAETDVDLMFEMILHIKDSKEFFLQKGAGWALRQYSKTDANLVIDFIQNNDLAPLTKREGLKWLKGKGLL